MSPPVDMLNPNTQCDSVCRWGLWEVIRSRHRGLSYKRPQRVPSTIPPGEDTVRRHLWTRKRAFILDTWSAGALNLGFSGAMTVRNKCPLFISYVVYNILLQQPQQTKADLKQAAWSEATPTRNSALLREKPQAHIDTTYAKACDTKSRFNTWPNCSFDLSLSQPV